MNKENSITKLHILFGLIFIILFSYVLIRAYKLSFTHDESLSYTIVQGNDTWKNTANNHQLNTLLMCYSNVLFGSGEFSLRLANVLSFIVYAIGCFLIFSSSKKIWLSTFGFALMLLNPFLIEYFSLARGYGLSLGFTILSIYFLIRPKLLLKDFFISFLFASLASFSNLALINLLFCVLIIFSIKFWLFTKNGLANLKFTIKFCSIFLISSILILLMIKRILMLSKLGQLYFGTSNLIDGFNSLIACSIYPTEYSVLIISTIKFLTIISFFMGMIYIIIKKKFYGELFYSSMLIFLLISGLLFENCFFKALYPTERTALYYIPVLAIFNYYLFVDLVNQFKIKKNYYIAIILFFIIPILINFIAKANICYTTTWKYDAYTKETMKKVKEYTQNATNNLTISNHWLFEPSINYYIDIWNLKLNPANRNGINLNSDFIYRLEENNKLEGFQNVYYFDDIKSELLIKTETNSVYPSQR